MIEQIQLLLEEAFRQDTLGLYFLMFGGGLLASVTPCTYPVLPLTIGYIGNQAGGSRLRAFFLSLSLVTGLAVVYAVLGGMVAAVGGTVGSILGNGWILYAIAMYYLMIGLFLLDVFQLPTIGFFSRLQTRSSNKKGVLGAFIIGGLSGLIVGPCTGPILAVALGSIALTLENAHGVAYALQIVKGSFLLFLFGFGQGALILLAGIFTGFIHMLPKAGNWMEAVKKGFALLIIAGASLLLVFVGQNTDFPSLTRFLAGLEPSAVQYSPPKAPSETDPVADKTPSASLAPDFTLTSLEGKPVSLGDYKGKNGVVLVFFATWCVNCMKEVPEIKHFRETAKRDNVIVFGMNYKQEEETVRRFKESNQINYEILMDTDGKVTTGIFGIRGIPHIIGINAKGEVAYRGTALPENQDEFIKNLKRGS